MRSLIVSIFSIVSMLSPTSAIASQLCVKESCFRTLETVEDEQISLVGAALYRYLLFDVYSAAFYASSPVTAQRGLDARRPMMLVIEYHRDISREDIIQAAEKVLREQLSEELLLTLRSRLDRFDAAYRSVKEKDRYALVYHPDVGTSLVLNGEHLVQVPGSDFATAYFDIWLHPERPISNDLRQRLVGVR